VTRSSKPTRAAIGSILYLALIALLGVATIIRDTAVSIGVVLGLLYLPRSSRRPSPTRCVDIYCRSLR
jgi:hypothetical protein